MPKTSAGILLYRLTSTHNIEVLLVHPGGPFWKNKDAGAWSIPKGEVDEGENPAATARREFTEELGHPAPEKLHDLGTIRQKSGKVVHAFAAEGTLDPATIQSNTFPLEWPPKSGKYTQAPEVDRAAWFAFEAAAEKLNPAQVLILESLRSLLKQ